MGDLRTRQSNQNGVLVGQNVSQLPSQESGRLLSEIPRDSWQVAEEETQLIIRRIQPTTVSESRRRVVVEYVQRLLRETLGSEVFPFGSVPLKTYLPDGDIDLTAICIPNTEEKMTHEVLRVLEAEEHNGDPRFRVKYVQFINAEVKLVKCLIQNIVVDISCNQIGGLCTLCFLEKVDRKIGKNNLFKRSIILIKAWCYYESRLLGAHHALISTYALETLVLYIFHLFHSSLNGPLEVLYAFLDYFSKFDWDNYCVSLRGPVIVSSLPEIVVAKSEQSGSDHLLSKEFLDECVNEYCVPPKITDNNDRPFPKKYLNIVDPLKESNNLGRSVNKGNFYRIRGAFSYGACKLQKILSLSKEDISCELKKFFTNTLERHGSGDRPDVLNTGSYNAGVPQHFENLSNKTTNTSTGMDVVEKNRQATESERQAPIFLQNGDTALRGKYVDGTSVSGDCLGQDVSDPSAAEFEGSETACEDNKSSCQVTSTVNCGLHPTETCENKWADVHKIRPTTYKSPIYMTVSEPYCGADGTDYMKAQVANNCTTTASITSNGGTTIPSSRHVLRNDVVDASISEAPSPSSNVSPDANSLAELSGDQKAQSDDLSKAQTLYSNLLSGTSPRNLPSPYLGSNPWEAFQTPNMYGHMNGVVPGPFPYDQIYYITPQFTTSLNVKEEFPRPRGTGIFFPNTQNYQQSYKDKQSHGRSRNPLASQGPKYRNNSRVLTPPEYTEKGVYAAEPTVQSPVSRDYGRPLPGKLESPRASPITVKASSEVPDLKSSHVEIGTFGPIPLDVSIPQPGKNLETNNLNSRSSASTHSPEDQKPQQSMNEERSEQLFLLKDEGDFPPLLGQGPPTTSTQPKLHKTAWGSRSRSS